MFWSPTMRKGRSWKRKSSSIPQKRFQICFTYTDPFLHHGESFKHRKICLEEEKKSP